MFVPVRTKDGQQLMPMRAARARKLVKRGEATPYFSNGIYCIRLNKEPSDRETQEIAVGVDPGSKKEGFTVKSESDTYLNIQADAHSKVGKKVEKRRELRRGRRSRKCPNRKNRENRLANRERIPAGTRARWDWKLRILAWLSKLYPITHVCVLAYHTVGGSDTPDHTDIFCISPIPIQRRALHREQPRKGGIRLRYGGTVLANGIVKNTLVKHTKYGLTRLSGINAKGLFAIYSLDGKRLTTGAKQNSFKVLTRLNFNYRSGHFSPT